MKETPWEYSKRIMKKKQEAVSVLALTAFRPKEAEMRITGSEPNPACGVGSGEVVSEKGTLPVTSLNRTSFLLGIRSTASPLLFSFLLFVQ